MEASVLGVIVAGGAAVDAVADGGDAALTPFAGRYRFIDFAQATLANSGVTTTYVLAYQPARALVRHLATTIAARRQGRQRPQVIALPDDGDGRSGRLLHALAAARQLAAKHGARTVVVLTADHILRLDLRLLTGAHRRLEADFTLAALPVPLHDAGRRTVLRVDADGRVRELTDRPERPVTAPDNGAFALSWAGDLVVRVEALDAVAGANGRPASALQALAETRRVMAFDVLDDAPGREPPRPTPYWHEPTTLEEYYEAQMELCTAHPTLDLSDPCWPMPTIATGLAPARVVTDDTGRAGNAHNALLSDGTVIRGGVLVNAVLGPRVTVESGAEVEDSVLLEGCRVGRHARVRRAVIGAGAVIEDGAEIGYGHGCGTARVLPSGLTLVPPGDSPAPGPAAGGR